MVWGEKSFARMNIPFVSQLIKRRNRRRVRAMMRGYRILKANNRLGWIRRTKRELADTQMGNVSPAASLHFFGAGTESAAQIVQQYVLTRIGGIGLNKALLLSIGSKNSPVIFPLPKEFQSTLARNGLAVSCRRCSALWIAYVGALWGYGVLSIAKHAYDAVRCIVRPTAVPKGPFAYFVGLAKNNLPQPCKDGRSHDILTWYAHWPGAATSLVALCHGVRGTKATLVNGKRVECVEHAIQPLPNLTGLIQFLQWATIAVLRSAMDACQGRWWHAALLSEAAKAAVVRFANPDQLACEYLFHFSDTIYRPIWTYEAIKKGSQVTCYFYSTSEEFKLPGGYESNSSYWKLMNWPRCLVWDSYQEHLLRLSLGDAARIDVVGPIGFNCSAIEMPNIPHNSIAVFDIQPIRSSAHFGFSTLADLDYGNPRVPMNFIRDAHVAVSLHGGTVVHKRKRNDGRRFRKVYRHMIDQLSRGPGFVSIEPDTSAIRVIEHCRAVVSMPFTSTAILGRYLGKPSVYYDPTGRLQKDDKGAHGIPILRGKAELQEWVSAVLGAVGENSFIQSA